jgi:aspartyl-tRNA(Asn)/glutamyl-tRNA(Gln) amidotransferase subunit A
VELRPMTACQAAGAVNRGEISARHLTEDVLERCSDLNKSLNTFLHIAGAEALDAADEVDQKVKSGQRLPLAGVPLAVKDDFCYRPLPGSFGSSAFKQSFSPYSAAAVEKLVEAGAVVIGKTNLDDMGIGSTTLSSPAGPALNPWSANRPAGSAGAAAVAAGQCLLALDSDTSGALRQGSSHCGVFGLRPTTGLISRYGLALTSSSFGQAGIISSAAEDIFAALQVLSGFDPRDAATAAGKDLPDNDDVAIEPGSLKIGCPSIKGDLLDADHRALFDQSRERFADNGFQLTEIKLNLLVEALRAYYVIALSEISSNLSRYDGIRFGKAADADNLDDLYDQSRGLTFGREARRASIFGTALLSQGSYDRYYRQALKVWNMVRHEFKIAFEKCDLIILPVVRRLSDLKIATEEDLTARFEEDLFCAPVSMAGLPSLTLPAGELEQQPVGIQLIGPAYREKLLIAVAAQINPQVKMPPQRAC